MMMEASVRSRSIRAMRNAIGTVNSTSSGATVSAWSMLTLVSSIATTISTAYTAPPRQAMLIAQLVARGTGGRGTWPR
jgi:hypothetical protein